MYSQLFIFDCDQTLWWSQDNDYVSSIESGFAKHANGVTRLKDGKNFYLRPEVFPSFELLSSCGEIGIVSDNHSEPVKEVLKLLKLWKFINKNAFNVRLWKGYCPKHLMVEEILNQAKFHSIARKRVWWFDDKDYAIEATKIGVNFIKVNQDSDIYTLVKNAR